MAVNTNFCRIVVLDRETNTSRKLSCNDGEDESCEDHIKGFIWLEGKLYTYQGVTEQMIFSYNGKILFSYVLAHISCQNNTKKDYSTSLIPAFC